MGTYTLPVHTVGNTLREHRKLGGGREAFVQRIHGFSFNPINGLIFAKAYRRGFVWP